MVWRTNFDNLKENLDEYAKSRKDGKRAEFDDGDADKTPGNGHDPHAKDEHWNRGKRDDKAHRHGEDEDADQPVTPLPVKPFQWIGWRDLPHRDSLYPKTYIRKFLTATIAPSGGGKSGLIVAEVLAMVTGRDILQDGFSGPPLRVWYWNGEDPADELQRQVQAAMHHYDITPADIGDRLILDSGRDLRIRIAAMSHGVIAVDQEMVDRIVATIRHFKIDVAIFDPFVTMHTAQENSNDAMDTLAGILSDIAGEANCATGIAMHTRKPASGFTNTISSDDARGGSAVVARARVARVIIRMTPDDAESAGIKGKYAHRSYFRISNDKASLQPPDEDDSWRYLKGVTIPNGDNVRVVIRWQYPDAFGGVAAAHIDIMRSRIDIPPAEGELWRENQQSKFWAGKLIGEIVGFPVNDKAGKKRATTILQKWIENGQLRKDLRVCGSDRKEHPVILRGNL